MLSNSTISKSVGLLIIVSACVSCSTNPENCSPQDVNNVLKAGSCLAGGGMAVAVERQRDELERLVRQRQLTDVETLALQKRSAQLAQEIALYRDELDDRKRELDLIRIKLSQFVASTNEDRAKKQVLEEAIGQLNSELESEKLKTQVTQEEVFMLIRDVERRRAVINTLTIDILEE